MQIVSALRTTGVATLLIEQNARAALQVSGYGYVLETGAVALEGEAAGLAHNPRVIETYLGSGMVPVTPNDWTRRYEIAGARCRLWWQNASTGRGRARNASMR